MSYTRTWLDSRRGASGISLYHRLYTVVVRSVKQATAIYDESECIMVLEYSLMAINSSNNIFFPIQSVAILRQFVQIQSVRVACKFAWKDEIFLFGNLNWNKCFKHAVSIRIWTLFGDFSCIFFRFYLVRKTFIVNHFIMHASYPASNYISHIIIILKK